MNTAYHSQYWAHALTLRGSGGDIAALSRSVTQEFLPADHEQALYDDNTAYLQRELLYALPASQRQLITMVLRKLLASSTFAIARKLPVAEIAFDYTSHPSKISVIEPLVGQSGCPEVSKLTVSAVEIEEFLVFAARTDHRQVLDEEICGKLLTLPARVEESPAEARRRGFPNEKPLSRHLLLRASAPPREIIKD